MHAVTLPSQVAAGSTCPLEMSTVNAGSVSAPPCTTVAFLQLRNAPDPAGTAPGRYQLRMCADAPGLIVETATTNNCLFTTEFRVTT